MNVANKPTAIEKSEFVTSSEKGSAGISYMTIGTTLQALSVQLDQGERINSEAGKMSWMTSNVKMETKGQGLGKMVSRIFASESLFINQFTCIDGTGIVTFSTDEAGKIIPVELTPEKPGIIFQTGAYLCSELGVERSTVLIKKLAAGLFGGKGFILQKLKGTGKAHLLADGEVVMYELKDGEKLLVDKSNLVAYEESVDFDIETVGGGLKNWVFGGEGIFNGVLRGPGKVWLQTRKLSLTSSAYAASAGRASNANTNPLGCIFGIAMSMLSFGCIIVLAILSSAGN